MRPSRSLATSLVRDPGGRLFGVFWGCLVAVDVAGLLRLSLPVATAAVAVVVAVGSWGQTGRTLLAAGGMGWLFVNGFLVNRWGDLRWQGTGDLWRLLLLLAVAWAAAEAGNLDGFLTPSGRRPHGPRVPSHGARGYASHTG